MKNLSIVIYYVLSFLLFSCNSINDFQPKDQENIPASVIEDLKSKFPNAQQVVYKAIEEDKLWEATFISDSKKYYAALATSGVVASYILSSGISSSIFDLIVEKISFPRGSFSNFRENTRLSNTGTSPELSAKYVIDSKDYIFTWFPLDNSRKKFVIQIQDYYKFNYTTNIFNNLPPNSQKIFKNNNLAQRESTIYLNEANEKTYRSVGLSADNKTVDYLFNHNGNILYSSQNFTITYNKSADFPAFAQQYLATNETQFKNFPIQSGVKFEDNGQIGYRFILYKAYPNLETYYLYFDESGKLTFLTYEALVTP